MAPALHGGRYAENYEVWKKAIPASQLKVVITEDLERDPDRVIREVLEFLGLSPKLMPRGSSHHCVTGKQGIMDEAPETQNGKPARRAGQIGTADTADPSADPSAAQKIAIGECTSDSEKRVARGGVKRYEMDAEAEETLRRFFAPYNAKLITLLGFDPGWARPGDVPAE